MTALPCLGTPTRVLTQQEATDDAARRLLLETAETFDAAGRFEEARRVRDLIRRLGL